MSIPSIDTMMATYLHETTGHITSFSSLDSSINQTFTTRDSVEKEFGRTETSKETVSDETLGRRAFGYRVTRENRSVLLIPKRFGNLQCFKK
jgi:hypothetical protein